MKHCDILANPGSQGEFIDLTKCHQNTLYIFKVMAIFIFPLNADLDKKCMCEIVQVTVQVTARLSVS